MSLGRAGDHQSVAPGGEPRFGLHRLALHGGGGCRLAFGDDDVAARVTIHLGEEKIGGRGEDPHRYACARVPQRADLMEGRFQGGIAEDDDVGGALVVGVSGVARSEKNDRC